MKPTISISNLMAQNRRITKPPTTDRPPTTNNRPQTHRQVLHQPSTHRQVLHRPTNHQPLTTNSPTDPPSPIPIDINSPTHRPTNHQLTDSPTLLQLTTNPLIHQTYFNRVAIGPILLIINFNSSFGMALFITEFVKLFIK